VATVVGGTAIGLWIMYRKKEFLGAYVKGLSWTALWLLSLTQSAFVKLIPGLVGLDWGGVLAVVLFLMVADLGALADWIKSFAASVGQEVKPTDAREPAYNLGPRFQWLVRQVIQLPVIGAGLVMLFFTVMFQTAPVVAATQGSLNQFPAWAVSITFIIWEVMVVGMLVVSMKLLRFRFRFRVRRGVCALGHGFPITIWNPKVL